MASSSSEEEKNQYTIGYAFSPKKQLTFIRSPLLSLAASRGLRLVPIDPSLPISSQSHRLHLLLHKLYDDRWISNLKEFAAQNPNVPIVDPPELVRRTQDRISMLRFVAELRIPSNLEVISDLGVENHHPCTFGVPKQIIVHEQSALADPAVISGMRFPVIAKPLASDGSSGSHKMALVFNHDGLLKQNPPLVLQEFVNHDGVVFKVYVAGDYIKCVERKSLPDLSNEILATFAQVGTVSFSQISNMTVTQDGVDKMHLDGVELPPEYFVTEIARGLRSAMGLNLFNFDMIRDGRIGNHYLVIDINYFPGYEKLPGYETVMADFLYSMVHKEEDDDSGSALGGDDGENCKHLGRNHCGNVEEGGKLG